MAEYTLGSVKTKEFDMKYLSFGRGKRQLVILPGMSLRSVMLSAEAVVAGYDLLADEFRITLFDREKPLGKGVTVSDMAHHTLTAIDSLGIDRFSLFGVSQGGMMAMVIASEAPEKVEKLVLGSTEPRLNPVSRKTFSLWEELGEKGDIPALNRSVFEHVYSEEYRNAFRETFAALEKEGTAEEAANFALLARACLTFDVGDALSRITCPTLVIGSHADNTFSGIGSVEIASRLGCRLMMYEGYSHAVYDEAPDYRARLLSFLTE